MTATLMVKGFWGRRQPLWALAMMVLTLTGVAPALAQTTPAVPIASVAPMFLQNPAGREGQLLNGEWSVIVDPAKVGSVSPFEGFPPVAFQTARPWSDNLVLQEWAFDPAVLCACQEIGTHNKSGCSSTKAMCGMRALLLSIHKRTNACLSISAR